MSVKKAPSGRRSVQIEVEAPGSTQPAVARRSAEAQLRTLIAKFAPTHLRLVGAMRRWLRKRMPTAHEVVYEYRDFFVISYSPNERFVGRPERWRSIQKLQLSLALLQFSNPIRPPAASYKRHGHLVQLAAKCSDPSFQFLPSLAMVGFCAKLTLYGARRPRSAGIVRSHDLSPLTQRTGT
jgi:hypothetical protein